MVCVLHQRLLNMIAAVLERLVQRKLIAINPIDVSKTGMMLINNVIRCAPVDAVPLQ